MVESLVTFLPCRAGFESLSFKAYLGNLPANVQSKFIVKNGRYNTRQENTFVIKHVRTTLKSMSISVKGVKIWNALDTSIKVCKSLQEFKNTIKHKFIEDS